MPRERKNRDTGGQLEREKWHAYPDTLLHFAGPPRVTVDLRRPVDELTRSSLETLGLGDPFAVLTAENPEGENAEDEESPAREGERQRENAARTSRLLSDLDEAALHHVAVEGSAPDGDYAERCVAVVLGRADAVALAERLGQLALFWFDGSRFWLLPAQADQEPTPLPPD